ncbi:hypothetical protein [Flavobacterium sp. NRK1]|uniref:hypothetical protein n=1 Tax=Flavobacterium sp. NRK1 TaxID=2954929 RepID=UPI002092B6EF|nr:hypothetical protein [Flavobacterium sp. NRK1]MCO6149052.1 hypothetical protein [Flavobacterium sp. NRK1]
MAQELINNGAFDNDPAADTLRVGFEKVNDNFTELYDFIAKKGKVISLGFTSSVVNAALIETKMDARTTVVGEKDCPLYIVITDAPVFTPGETGGPIFGTFSPSKKYVFAAFLEPGTYGVGGTNTVSSNFYLISVLNLQPEDITSDPDAVIDPLGTVPDGQTFVDVANESLWDFSDSGEETDTGIIQHYFSFTADGKLMFALFTGTPGTYGDGGTADFTDEMFVITTDDAAGSSPYALDNNVVHKTGETSQDVDGDLNIDGNVSSTQQPTSAEHLARKDYVDALVTGIVRLAGDWDASGGTYPTTGTGSGGAVRRGDSYIVSVEGAINGSFYGVGDSFYSKVNSPGQTPSNWARFEVPSGIGTSVLAGIGKLYTGTGSNTDGSMTQNAITSALANSPNWNAAFSWGDYKTSGWGTGVQNNTAYTGDVFAIATTLVVRVSNAASNLPVNESGVLVSYFRSTTYGLLIFHADSGGIYYNIKNGAAFSTGGWKRTWSSSDFTTTDIANWNAKQAALVSGTNIKTIEGQSLLGSGNIDLTKSDVGLSNVDNTSDLSKPVSTATQAVLDAKQATLVSGTNIKSINGNSLIGSGNLVIDSRPYKVYTALITQSGTSAPTVTILENTLSGPISWVYTSTGLYTGTLNAAFVLNKTWAFINLGDSSISGNQVKVSRINTNDLGIRTFNSSNSAADGVLNGASLIEIRVYN